MPRVAGAQCVDFFNYPSTKKFKTIIGNPPYVRHQDIPVAIRDKLDYALLDRRSNLYLFFIEKCLRHLTDGGRIDFYHAARFY